MKKSLFITAVFLGVITSFMSCVQHKKLIILDSENENADSITVEEKHAPYFIQAGDFLNIKISSVDPSSAAIFNKNTGSGGVNNLSEPAIYLTSYVVDDSGAVNLPIIGKVILADQTLEDAVNTLENKLSEYYKFVSVDIKLMSFRISVLGEVFAPGVYTFYNQNVNILQVLSKAKGITDLGNRRKVKVVRKTDNKIVVKTINLNAENVFDSEFYYLQPDDAIYVEPLKVKSLRVNTPTIQLLFSTLTFVLVVAGFLRR